ncbi:MAG TPA: TetR/AcrR family transcriptional regulator [Pseudomonadales bacterium]
MTNPASIKQSVIAGDGRRKPRPGPREQSRAIVEASVVLFLAHGVRSVSIMQICDQADVSRSTFYRSFDGMDALLEQIYRVSVFEPVEQFMRANLRQRQITPAQIKLALDGMYEAIFDQAAYAELIFRESNDPSSPAFAVVNQAFDKVVLALQNSLPRAAGRPIDAVFLKAILNANQWIVHDAIRKGLTAKNKKAAKAAAWQLVSKALDL